ncbi:hypothetical protein [Pseudomonas sp. CGJS7]|uniref:hypothetical protein n=1 Tax=Pseudomonas sp. CGJS7 TaxID=3109348 RepID=UPI00300AFE0E
MMLLLRKLRLPTLIILISHGVSSIVLLFLPSDAARVLVASSGRIESLASLLASFAFTMAGFLAAILALFGVMSGSVVLARYQKKGHLSALLFVMGVTVFELMVTFVASLRLFFVVPTQCYVELVAWLVAADLMMLIFSTLPVIMLVKGTIESVKE